MLWQKEILRQAGWKSKSPDGEPALKKLEIQLDDGGKAKHCGRNPGRMSPQSGSRMVLWFVMGAGENADMKMDPAGQPH